MIQAIDEPFGTKHQVSVLNGEKRSKQCACSASPDSKTLLDVPELLLGIIRRQHVHSTRASLLSKLVVARQEHPPLLTRQVTQACHLAAWHISPDENCVQPHTPANMQLVTFLHHIHTTYLTTTCSCCNCKWNCTLNAQQRLCSAGCQMVSQVVRKSEDNW